MPVRFEKVEQEVIALVQEAIDQWHPVLQHARLGVCFRSEEQKRGTHAIWATISKVSPHVGVLAHLDYVLWFAKPVWERLPRAGRLALIDHELCHAIENDSGDWAIREHDVEEFYEVIERHGLWRTGLMNLGKVVTAAQASFPGFDDDLAVTWQAPGKVVTLDPAAAAALAAG